MARRRSGQYYRSGHAGCAAHDDHLGRVLYIGRHRTNSAGVFYYRGFTLSDHPVKKDIGDEEEDAVEVNGETETAVPAE